MGPVVMGASLPPYLAASNVIPSDDSDFGVPRWALAWIVVLCFFLPGLAFVAGVRAGDGGRTHPGAGVLGPLAAAILPAALAAHACIHALTRTGAVRAAWLGLAALAAVVAALYLRRLVRVVGPR